MKSHGLHVQSETNILSRFGSHGMGGKDTTDYYSLFYFSFKLVSLHSWKCSQRDMLQIKGFPLRVSLACITHCLYFIDGHGSLEQPKGFAKVEISKFVMIENALSLITHKCPSLFFWIYF